MKPISSKQFKKQYAATMDNIPDKGVWSGRGIGVPALGANDGSGDGSKNLGRPRRPYYDGEQGSPSQSADSAFSSYLARVNKGYEYDEFEDVMFPEQEPPESDTYSMSDVPPALGTKLPRSFKVMRGRARFNENDIVENSRYSLSNPKIEEGMISQMVGDIAGDIGAAAVGAIPGVGMGATAAFIALNIKQLTNDMTDSDIAIEAFRLDPNDDTVQELDDVLDSISINLIDLLQRTLELLPDAELPVGEAASILTSIINNLVKLKGVLSKVGLSSGPNATKASQVWGKVKVVGFVTPVLKFFMELLDSGQAPDSIRENQSVILSVPRKMILLGDLMEDYWTQKEAAERVNQPFRYVNRVITPETSMANYDYESSAMRLPADQRGFASQQAGPSALTPQVVPAAQQSSLPGGFTQEDLYRLILTGQEPPMRESNESQRLRKFIRESLMTDLMPVYQDAQPVDFEYRRPEVIVQKDLEEDKFEVLDNYDDYSVAYKTDGGVVSYQTRNKLKEESESETALRNLIRNNIRTLVSESQKKK